MVKCCLKLDSEIHASNYEAGAAHFTIVMICSIFTAAEEQLAIDQRTIEVLFHAVLEEIRDIVIAEVFV